MSTITFPLFNLKMDIPRVAFEIFGVKIYWYAIIIVSAIIIALLVCKKNERKFGIDFATILDLLIFLIPISIISARLYYVLFNLDSYITQPERIFNLRAGGLAIYGGIIGGAITCYIFCKKRKINLLDLFDYIVPSLALAQSIGRWGNFFNSEAYGHETSIFCRMGVYEAGKYIEVHPTFLYESVITLGIFIILQKITKKRKFKGELTVIYLILYSFFRMLIEGVRADSLMMGNVRISQVLSGVIFVTLSFFLTYKKIKNKKIKTDVK